MQDFVDGMLADGLSASTINVALNPLRAVYRRAAARGFVAVNPTRGLELPASRDRRDRIASPDEAQEVLAALPDRDRPIWAMALYAGLRRGELMALDWSHIDLASGVIRVERSWDDVEGLIGLKSKAGKRNVPIPPFCATTSTSIASGPTTTWSGPTRPPGWRRWGDWFRKRNVPCWGRS